MSYPLIPGERRLHKAFTLIELLTVIAIIGVLAAITFGVSKGVRERASISRAQTELAVLSTALESYKRQYGDYPQTGGLTSADPDSSPDLGDITADTRAQAALFNALAGRYGPKLAEIKGRSFIDLSKMKLERPDLPDPATDDPVRNALLDPWGRRYMYFYKNKDSMSDWEAPSYVLFSAGPDGKADLTTDLNDKGVVDYEDADNLDNIYANR